MRKVMIIANNDVGLYKFRKELLEELLKAYEVHIVLPHGEFVEKMIDMGCKYYSTEFNRHGVNPLKEISLLKEYKKIISRVEPDIVLTYTIKPNIYAGIVCAQKKIPYIANITGLGTAVENKGILQKITVAMYRYALRKAKKVFFQNEENLQFMKKERILRSEYDLLPGSGVNLQYHQPLLYPQDDTVNFLFVARVMKEKGIDQYLDAAKFIHEKYPYTQFHVCGACEEDYKGILNDLQTQGVITYHGLVRDMREMYAMSSCTIHPTYYPEGMSNVLLESCASARPIITTDRSGCREIVDNNVNGFICKQQDSQDLIEKIEKFLQLTRTEQEKMGLLAREKVEKEFDRNIVVGKYLKELQHE